MVVAWTRVVSVEAVRNGEILHVFKAELTRVEGWIRRVMMAPRFF